MKIFIILIALHVQVFSQSVDPFAKKVEEPPRQPQRIAPSGKELKSFDEPVLKGSASKDSGDMRFIHVPTFGKPVSIRVTKTGDKVNLRAVRLSGKGGYEWGKIQVQKTLPLTLQQWNNLITLSSVDGAREPSLKATKELRENFVDAMSGLDGEIWYLEVRDMNGYTVEGVPNPHEGNEQLPEASKLDFRPFLAVCLKLFELSGLDEKSEP